MEEVEEELTENKVEAQDVLRSFLCVRGTALLLAALTQTAS